jgi:hypothetical protein
MLYQLSYTPAGRRAAARTTWDPKALSPDQAMR